METEDSTLTFIGETGVIMTAVTAVARVLDRKKGPISTVKEIETLIETGVAGTVTMIETPPAAAQEMVGGMIEAEVGVEA